jgi:predicted dinucleotide-binding enzyme
MFNRRQFIHTTAFAATAFAATTAALVGVSSFAHGADSAARKTKIGIIGSGNVGSALGRTWAKAGHEVMFASRNLEHDRQLAKQIGAGARAGSPREAAAFGEVILMSVPYRALPELGKDLVSELKGKIVIDACNAFPGRDGDIANWAREKGVGLASAELLPGTRIVRAFNALSAERMAEVHETPGRVGMPIAGDDKEAIETASRLIRDIGFEPVLIGGLAMGKHLMPGTAFAGERTPEEIRKIRVDDDH